MRVLIVCFCIFFPVTFVFAQYTDTEEEFLISGDSHEEDSEEEIIISDDSPIDTKRTLWISFGAETAMYSRDGFCYGGSLAFAYGKGVSVGLKTAYFFDIENRIDVLELGFLLRFYLRGSLAFSGPFIQVSGGHALFIRLEDGLSIPSQWGTIYGGAEIGWRFILGNTYFIEPFIRGGYPYITGGGLLLGVIF